MPEGLEYVRLSDFTFAYEDGKKVLSHVSCEILPGDSIAVRGENGAGKSTLLKVIAGLKKPADREERKKIINTFSSVGYLSQLDLTTGVFASVEEILSLGTEKRPFRFLTKKDKENIRRIAEEFRIAPFLKKKFNDLSGGQKQKVRLAEVLLGEPHLLLLDEPSTGIDEGSRKEIRSALEKKHAEGMTIVTVSHLEEDFLTGSKKWTINAKGELIK